MHKSITRNLNFFCLVCVFCLPCFFPKPVSAQSTFQTRVKVIEASKGPAHVDPGIRNIVKEIQPVFNYTRFKVLKEKSMHLSRGQEGRLSLPGNRALIIIPEGMKGKRIRYNIRINAKGNPVFQTGVMLKNNNSVTLGGPKTNRGILLLDIQGHAH